MADIEEAVKALCDAGHPHYQQGWKMRRVANVIMKQVRRSPAKCLTFPGFGGHFEKEVRR